MYAVDTLLAKWNICIQLYIKTYYYIKVKQKMLL